MGIQGSLARLAFCPNRQRRALLFAIVPDAVAKIVTPSYSLGVLDSRVDIGVENIYYQGGDDEKKSRS